MKTSLTLAALSASALALAACGSSDPASTEATPADVEMPANVPLEPVTEEPVDDETLTDETADGGEGPPPAVTEQSAEDAAAEASAKAEELAAAAAEAEAAASAAEDAGAAALEAVEGIDETVD
ncbi:MAG: hypothetical protein AAF127_06545 [Pseudomonadota bacterium]